MKPPRFVYFAQREDGTGPIKIGCSAWPKCRVRDLGIGQGAPLKLLKAIAGGTTGERVLHLRFAAHRLYGEWFEPTEELLSFIETAQSGDLLTDAQRGRACEERYLAGDSAAAIGKDFHISRTRVLSILTERGIAARPRGTKLRGVAPIFPTPTAGAAVSPAVTLSALET